MTLEQYRKETLRTMLNLGSNLLDSLHMTVGIMTEIGEIQEAFDKSTLDLVNLSEEVSDIMWYASNYANLHDLEFIYDGTHYMKTRFGDLIKYAGKLLDIDKKHFAYGKVIDPELRQYNFGMFWGALFRFAQYYNIDLGEGRARNIAKLRARFPEKFDTDKAINRDLDVERKILEGTN